MFWGQHGINGFNSPKHLGLILDSELTFNRHLKEKISKTNNGILRIRKLYCYLCRSILLTVYKSFITSHLDYCDAKLIPRKYLST